MKLLVQWLLSAASLLVVASFYSGVHIGSWRAALIATCVIGVFNILLRPLLVVLTLPVTILTLGLFLLIINAVLFWLAATLLPGFHVRGFMGALIGSALYSLLGVVIDSALRHLFPQK